MKKNSTSNFIFIYMVVLFFSIQSAFSQLTDFILQVTTINESCTANGRLNFIVTNTTAGATILYTVYKLPNTTEPLALISGNTLTGLVSGNYRVIATQSLNELSNSQQQDVFISNTIGGHVNYTLTARNAVCGSDGRVTVVVTQSTAVSYEIFSGPVIRPLQMSNIFDNLPGGTYSVRVFDVCGEGVVRTVTLSQTPAGLAIGNGFSTINTCDSFNVSCSLTNTQGHTIAYPITIETTVILPIGPPLVFLTTQNVGSNVASFSFIAPAIYTQPYTYNVVVTDGCGNNYVRNGIVITNPTPIGVSLQSSVVVCDKIKLEVYPYSYIYPVTINFLSAPEGFNPLTFNSNSGPFISSPINYYNPSIPLPQGTYVIQIIDACGRTGSGTITLTAPPAADVSYISYPGCENGIGSVLVSGENNLISGQIVSAPAGYPFSLPQNLSSYLVGGKISMGSLIAGTYVFSTVDSCNQIKLTTVIIEGFYEAPATATITENCDSFNLNFSQQGNGIGRYYWMQKFYPAANQWGHPITGYIGLPNDYSFLTASPISNGFTNYNIQSSGEFKIIRQVTVRLNGSTQYNFCVDQVYNFEYTIGLRVNSINSFSCNNSLYDAVVNAGGIGPLQYRITSKNGQPFFVDNNFSNVFIGLEPTVYNFQIEDACGNILNSLFDISNPDPLLIQSTVFCENQSGSLSVPGFSFLNYEWRKGNDTTILSTSSTLNFPSFHASTDNGIYHVRVFYADNPNSCVDFIIDYQISITDAPNAGDGQDVQYCGEKGIIDLFSLLSGNYDSTGTWQELTNSGFLTNNLWNATTIVQGDFHFKYSVDGSCGIFDESNVVITIKPLPEMPFASMEEVACDSKTLNLLSTSIPFGDYLWSGPNGFTSSEQNPSIENISVLNEGIYTVKAHIDDCESAQSNVEVVVNSLPQFSLKKGCVNNQYTLSTLPINNSFNPLSANYSWTGPQGFTSLQNPIQITGLPAGFYNVTITNIAGCSAEQSIEVSGTQCTIPNVITPNNDSFNDQFDLSSLQVNKLEIYNRWGRLVYNQNNYTNQWHGQNNENQQLPDSTYYYVLSLMSGEEKQGWVFVNGSR